MATVLFTDTLTQNIGESDTDFGTRVQQYVSDQQYYFEQVGGSFPSPRADQSGYLGFPPSGPDTSTIVYDPTNTQLVRQVTFAYDNIYYYKYLNTTPSIPPPSPLPISGDIAIFASNGVLTDGQIGVDTVSLNFTNLMPATVNGQAVEYSQFAAAIAGFVPSSRTLSINGIGYDLSADRSWSVGTVTGFSSGDLSPIFTTSVATATTTPALSFSLSTQSANTVFAGPSISPDAAPTFRSLVLGDLPSGVGLTANPLSQFAATSSAQLAGVISDETGTGSLVFATSPALVTPNIDTPSAGVLTNCTGLPIAGLTGLGTGIAAMLAQSLEFVDFSGTAAPTGFSSVTVSMARYLIIYKLCICVIRITGTSNAATFTFTAPATAANTDLQRIVGSIQNGGAATAGLLSTAANSNTLQVLATAGGGTFSSSGTKSLQSIFFFETT